MIIPFDKKIYNLIAIENTIKAYQELANFEIKTDKNKITVKAEGVEKETEDVFKDEFCNYALSEMKKIKSICLEN
jgi:hypothetical protein